MRTWNTYVVSLTALLAMISCTKENADHNVTPNDPTTKEVVLKLASGAIADSRAIESPVVSSQAATLNDGLVYFLDAQGNVLSNAALAPATVLSATGQLFSGIAPSATQVYIVGNCNGVLPSIMTALQGATTISAIHAVTAAITTQQDGAANVVLANALDPVNNAAYDAQIKLNGANYEAKVLLAPVLSRIQVADIKTVDPLILSYKFAGMYVDNFYPSFYVAPTLGGAGTIQTAGTNAALLGTFGASMCDIPAAAVASVAKAVTAAQAKGVTGDLVWGYQVTPTLGGSANTPRLIIKLTDVMVTNGQGGAPVNIGTQYITVTGFTTASGTIQNFQPGTVYNVPAGSFVFNLGNLATTPNAQKINVTVFVKVENWIVSNVGVAM